MITRVGESNQPGLLATQGLVRSELAPDGGVCERNPLTFLTAFGRAGGLRCAAIPAIRTQVSDYDGAENVVGSERARARTAYSNPTRDYLRQLVWRLEITRANVAVGFFCQLEDSIAAAEPIGRLTLLYAGTVRGAGVAVFSGSHIPSPLQTGA